MDVPLLVVGAGPYGLATAAHAKRRGIEPPVAGEPMAFWRRNMPERMLLRSGTDWHFDAAGVDTFEAFLIRQGIEPAELSPVPLQTFLDYAGWFAERAGIRPRRTLVTRLERAPGGFAAGLEDGASVTAAAVVAAPGIASFPVIPDWLPASLPDDRWSHTCSLVSFERLEDARLLIVGGRQSAFELAALLAEAEREAIGRRLWAEGRLKLESSLTPQLPEGVVHGRPLTSVAA